MTTENTGTVTAPTAPAAAPVPTSNGQANPKAPAPTGAGALLKEVQGAANGTAGGTVSKPGKKGGKKAGAKAPAAAPAPTAPAAPGYVNAPVTLDFENLPEPELRHVERKELFLDRRLQHRKEIQDIKEGGAVEQYGEALKAGKKFPPIEAIEDVSETKAKGTLWVWDGFQRTGAYAFAGIKDGIPVNVRKGTFADAMMLSLRQNSENSVLPRTKDDARRAVFALIDNEDVLSAVLKSSKGGGGFNRVAASVCDVSSGTVSNALAARGLKAKGDKLVKAPKPPAEPAETAPDGGLSAPVAKESVPSDPAEQRKADVDAFTKLRDRAPANLVTLAVQSAKRMAAVLASLVTDPKYGATVRETLAGTALCESSPIGVSVTDFDAEAKEEKEAFFPYYSMLSNWRAVNELCESFNSVAKAIDAKDKAEQEAKAASEAKDKADKEAAKAKAKSDKDAADAKAKAEAEQAKAKEQAKAGNAAPAPTAK